MREVRRLSDTSEKLLLREAAPCRRRRKLVRNLRWEYSFGGYQSLPVDFDTLRQKLVIFL